MFTKISKKILMCLLLFMLLLTAACGNNNSSNSGESESNEPTNEGTKESEGYSGIVPVYTPGAGGIAYILSAGISKVFNNKAGMSDIQLATEATNGSADIMQFVIDRYSAGKPAFGALAAETVTNLYDGNYDKIEGAHEELRGVGFLSATSLHVVVPADSSIKDFSDLKGKKLGASPGAATTTLLKNLLEEGYGLTEKDYQHIPIDYAEIQQGLQNGSIDAGLINGAIPAPLVKETESLTDIRILSVGEEELAKFIEKYPYHSSRTVPAGTYKNQTEEITIPALQVIYATHAKTDDEIVYNFVKTIMENNEEISAIHPVAKNITPETILNGITVPLHPGAEKYYKEQGIME